MIKIIQLSLSLLIFIYKIKKNRTYFLLDNIYSLNIENYFNQNYII